MTERSSDGSWGEMERNLVVGRWWEREERRMNCPLVGESRERRDLARDRRQSCEPPGGKKNTDIYFLKMYDKSEVQVSAYNSIKMYVSATYKAWFSH